MSEAEAPVPSREEYEAARTVAAAYERAEADRLRTERAAYLAALRAVVDDPAFETLLGKLSQIVPTYATDPAISVHLTPLPGFLTRLRGAAA